MNSSESATYSIEQIVGEKGVLSEISRFFNKSDYRFFLANKRLYREIFFSNDEIAIRQFLRTFRSVLDRISLIEEPNPEAVNAVHKDIDEMCLFFSALTVNARYALNEVLPSLSCQPLSTDTLRKHCIENLDCRLTQE